MFSRTFVAASASALLAAPAAHAEDDGAGAGSLDAGSLELGSLDGGSLASLGDDEAGGADVGTDGDAPDAVCDLPDLGGSVAKFYPLSGLEDMPAPVMDVITSALDAVPNVLELVAGEGNGAGVVGQAGSLADPLCTSILGGEMTQPPVTVVVDEDGGPVTTVTGTVAAAAPANATVTRSVREAVDGGEAGQAREPDAAVERSGAPLPTTVPTGADLSGEGSTAGR